MTLKEKFRKYCTTTVQINQDQSQYTEIKYAEECEKIADEFAIGFGQWMAKEYWLNSSGKYTKGQTHKELLEIYKKEKGL